jgi:hypothetical protein
MSMSDGFAVTLGQLEVLRHIYQHCRWTSAAKEACMGRRILSTKGPSAEAWKCIPGSSQWGWIVQPSFTETIMATKPKGSTATKTSKHNTVLKLLRSNKGATIGELQKATGWQPHSVRGFLSGTVKRRLGLALKSEQGKSGERRYSIAAR